MPAARLRGAVWQSIFTHDMRRYRRSLYRRMGAITTLVHGSVALAASFQKTDGTVIDPILDTASSTHPYNGPDLEPDA